MRCSSGSAVRQAAFVAFGLPTIRAPLFVSEATKCTACADLRFIAFRAASRPRPALRSPSDHIKPRLCASAEKDGKGNSVTTHWSKTLLSNWVPCLAFAAFVIYTARFAPNQTPMRDMYYIEKFIGIGVDDGVPINAVLFSVFFLMGVLPLALSSLIVPSARSANKVPAWPFLSASFFVGMFALFPYLCLWEPRVDNSMSPPSQDELRRGVSSYMMRALESRWLAGLNLLSATGLLVYALTAGPSAWNVYAQYFDESKFIHIMSIDFTALVSFLAFFMCWDADKRDWDGRGYGVPVLAAIPILGPLVYLLLRPRSVLSPAATAESDVPESRHEKT